MPNPTLRLHISVLHQHTCQWHWEPCSWCTVMGRSKCSYYSATCCRLHRNSSSTKRRTQRLNNFKDLIRHCLSTKATMLFNVSTGTPCPCVPPKFWRLIFDSLHSLSHPGVKATQCLIIHAMSGQTSNQIHASGHINVSIASDPRLRHTFSLISTYATPDVCGHCGTITTI